MRHIYSVALMGAAALAAARHNASAAVLALYDCSSTTGSGSSIVINSTDADTNSAAGGLSAGSGLLGVNPGDGVSYNGFGLSTGNPSNGIIVRSTYTPATLAAAISGNVDMAFTITPGAATSLQLSNLAFDVAASYSTGGTMNANVAVYSSLNGYASALKIPTTIVTSSSTLSWSTVNIDLSSYAAIDSATTFVFYMYDDQGSGGTIRFDNVILSGDVSPVPEPASIGILAAFGGGLLVLRRKTA